MALSANDLKYVRDVQCVYRRPHCLKLPNSYVMMIGLIRVKH